MTSRTLALGIACAAFTAIAPAPDAARPAAAVRPTLTIARLQYDGGGDWYANPSSIPNLLAAIAERTTLHVAKEEARVTPLDARLADYPFIHATGHGTIRFSDTEAARLHGATDAQIAEASMMGGMTMLTSTFLNAEQVDYKKFHEETLKIISFVKAKQVEAGKQPSREHTVHA